MRIIVGLMAFLLISGEAVSMEMESPASLPRQHVVEIQAFRFQPTHMVVAPGDIVIWINQDVVPHTVTANSGTWTSQKLEEGQSLKVVVANGGVYSYFCQFHPHMTGVLTAR